MKFALGVAKQSGSSIIGLSICSLPIFIETIVAVKHRTKQKSEKIIKNAKMISQKSKVSFTGIIKNNNIGKTIVFFAESHRIGMIVRFS